MNVSSGLKKERQRAFCSKINRGRMSAVWPRGPIHILTVDLTSDLDLQSASSCFPMLKKTINRIHAARTFIQKTLFSLTKERFGRTTSTPSI